jgi:hypothetical protein
VLTSGSHAVSAVVCGLPSSAASRTALIGRQNSQRALPFQVAIAVSAAVM